MTTHDSAIAAGLPQDLQSGAAGTILKVLRIVIPLVLLGIMIAVFTTIDREQVEWLVDRLQGEWRVWAIPGLVVIGAGLTAVGFPGTIVSLTAGAAFGFVLGFPVALASAFAAACLTAAVGRRLGHPPRDRVANDRGSDGPKRSLIERISLALGDADWRFIALLRIAPVLPYAAANFLLGSYHVRWAALIGGTVVGLLPGTAAHVYLAAAGRRLLSGGSLHPIEALRHE